MSGATVLFDFDGTLVRGDCAAAWLRSRLTDSTWRKLAGSHAQRHQRKPGFRNGHVSPAASLRHVESVSRDRSHAAAAATFAKFGKGDQAEGAAAQIGMIGAKS